MLTQSKNTDFWENNLQLPLKQIFVFICEGKRRVDNGIRRIALTFKAIPSFYLHYHDLIVSVFD